MLKELFISEVRVRVLRVVLLESEEPLHVREIVRRVGTEINAVRRELKRLRKIGLLHPESRGNRIYYHVDKNFSLYPELISLLAKDAGLGWEMTENLPHLGKVKLALLSSEFVRGRVADKNEIDLLLVGEEINMPLLGEIISRSEKKHGHEVNYTVLNEEEFDWRRRRKDPFLLSIVTSGRIVLAGDEALLAVN